MVSLKHSETFHKKKKQIPAIVRKTIGKDEVIYGERALNARFPNWLDRHTEDFDVYSKTPKKDAKQSERALDKAFGGNYFYTEPAQHKGTHKVKAYANQTGYVDYTKPEKKMPPSEVINGKRYVKLNVVKAHIKKTLKDKEAQYRHAKDRDALSRIKVYEKMQKVRAKKRKPVRKKQVGFGWGF